MVIEDQIWQKNHRSSVRKSKYASYENVLCQIFSMILIQFKNYVLIYSRYRKDNLYVCVAFLELRMFIRLHTMPCCRARGQVGALRFKIWL